MKLNKIATTLILTLFSMGFSATATVIIPDSSPGSKWAAEKSESHSLFNTPACLSKVQSQRGRGQLEVISPKVEGAYLSPTVNFSAPKFSFSGIDYDKAALIVTVRGVERTYKMLAAAMSPKNSDLNTLVVKVDDRADAIADIKAGSLADIQLYKDGDIVRELRFSLSGSHRATTTMIDFCQVGVI